ncbi:MAG: hypothetical protein CMB77_06955, partial [Euryarchaeota archaeon]|nr:hypothetical protein [Euryarchaeota archaeon]
MHSFVVLQSVAVDEFQHTGGDKFFFAADVPFGDVFHVEATWPVIVFAVFPVVDRGHMAVVESDVPLSVDLVAVAVRWLAEEVDQIVVGRERFHLKMSAI